MERECDEGEREREGAAGKETQHNPKLHAPGEEPETHPSAGGDGSLLRPPACAWALGGELCSVEARSTGGKPRGQDRGSLAETKRKKRTLTYWGLSPAR